MDKNKTRVLHTKLYGQRAHDILSALSGQMSDGIWENSPSYNKYWLNFDVATEPNGETVIYVSTEYSKYWCHKYVSNPFINMSETDFFAWLAGKLKTAIRIEAKDNNWKKGWWKRDNTTITSCYLNRKLDITVADIYCVYDELLGRQTHADETVRSRIFGQKADDATIAKRTELAEAKAKAHADYKEHIAMLDEKLKKFTAEIVLDKEQAREVYIAVLENLEKKYKIA